MKKDPSDFDRGKIEVLKLKRTIRINTAVIEIDHINYVLNKKTKSLKKKRTDFSLADIEEFILQLDEEQIIADAHKGRISKYAIRVDCPVKG